MNYKNKLGKSNAEKILKFLKDAGYSKTLFFNAYLDTPLVGTIRDVRTHSVTEIIDMLHKEKLPKLVMIFLKMRIMGNKMILLVQIFNIFSFNFIFKV